MNDFLNKLAGRAPVKLARQLQMQYIVGAMAGQFEFRRHQGPFQFYWDKGRCDTKSTQPRKCGSKKDHAFKHRRKTLANPLDIAISKIRAGFVINAKNKLFQLDKAIFSFFECSPEEMKRVKLRIFFPPFRQTLHIRRPMLKYYQTHPIWF